MSNEFKGDHEEIPSAVADFVDHYGEVGSAFMRSLHIAGKTTPGPDSFTDTILYLARSLQKEIAKNPDQWYRTGTGRVVLEYDPSDGGEVSVNLYLGAIYGTPQIGFTVDEDLEDE